MHFVISERVVASLGVTERGKDAIHWDAAHERTRVAVRWRLGESPIENGEELHVICDLTR